MNSDAARALVESLINGELTQAERTETVHSRFAGSFLPLTHSPVTAVSSVTAGGRPITNYRVTPFGLELSGGTWPREVTVEYVTGWPDYNEPPEVKAALERAEGIDEGVTSDRIGGLSVTRDATASVEGLRRLLRRWVRP